MKTKLLIFIVLFTSCFSSCEKPNLMVDINVDFYYSDKDGKDLLDPATPNAYKKSDIDLYYMIDGVKTRVYNGLMDTPENFKFYYLETLHRYCLIIAANDRYDANQMSETLIDFGDRVDTLTVSFTVSANSLIVKSVWYNHVLKAEEFHSLSAPITITVDR